MEACTTVAGKKTSAGELVGSCDVPKKSRDFIPLFLINALEMAVLKGLLIGPLLCPNSCQIGIDLLKPTAW